MTDTDALDLTIDKLPEPRRIQRRRTKGWRMPENTVYVGRPTRWGNPYVVGQDAHSAAEAVDLYRSKLETDLRRKPDILEPLRGMNLACWCKLSDECHANVLLELAND